MMSTVVDHADKEEHPSRGDSVSDHLEHGAIHSPFPVLGPGAPDGDTENDVAHVRDRTISDKLLEIGLSHGGKSAVDNVDHTKDCQAVREILGRPGTNRVGDPQDAVATQLEQDA